MRPIDADALTEFLKCLLPERGMWKIEGDTVKNAVCETVAEAIEMVKNMETIQPEKAQLFSEDATFDLIRKFIDGLEEIFADLRERHVDDSVCGLCEYDGAYMGQSGDWCNECPGFDRDDCFKLSDETRRKWTAEIIKALLSVQPEPAIPLSWIENEIKWLKSLDSTFSEITALQISAMVNKWRDEQNERTD